jgi:phage/plasmid-like protein (TIGR03299 family)
MSKESTTWLNTMVLVGMGHRAWHYSAEHQGAESSHYDGPIPYEDVVRRLFHWQAVPGNVTSTGMTENGVFTVTDPDRKTMLRPPGALGADDQGAILGVFSSGYEGHQYKPWLLDQVKELVEAADVADLGIGSAALLEQGGVAFVSIETPQWLTTPEGIEYKPRLLCVTSFNGSKATTYKFVIGNAVCDNTMSACLREKGAAFRVKHTRNSALKINDARAELGIMFREGEDAFAADVAALCDSTVTDSQWERFLLSLAPEKDPKTGKEKTGAAKTKAENKRAAIDNLWRNDTRVAPWAGSAWGVVQAVNTYTHHLETVRGKSREERNAEKMISGDFDKLDAGTLSTLDAVLASA